MLSGVYVIQNQVNTKLYVGSSCSFERRWYEHKRDLEKQVHDNQYLQNAWNKYGEDAFLFMEHELVEPIKEILLEREQFWMDFFRSYEHDRGYNLCQIAGAGGSNRGEKISTEHHRKLCTGRRVRHSQHTEEAIEQFRREYAGEKGLLAKLSWEKVRKIRKEYATKQFSMRQLGEQYDVDSSQISRIVNYVTWVKKYEPR